MDNKQDKLQKDFNSTDGEENTIKIDDIDDYDDDNPDGDTTELTSVMRPHNIVDEDEEATQLMSACDPKTELQEHSRSEDDKNEQNQSVVPFNGDPSSFKPLTYNNVNNNVKDDKPKTKKPLTKKTIIVSGLALAVCVIACIYLAFFTPSKRVSRYLEKGNKAYEKSQYNLALENYDKVLDIDNDNLAAMLGTLKSYDAVKDVELLKKSYEEYCDIITPLASSPKTNKELMVEIYMMANSAYADDIEARIAALEEAIVAIPGNQNITDSLISDYIALAVEYARKGDFENEINMYNKVLELDSANATAINSRKACAENVLNGYIENNQSDEAYAFIEKYQTVIVEVDFKKYKEDIDSKVKIKEAFDNIMNLTTEYLSCNNYDDMLSVNGSVDAVTVYNNIGDYYIFAPEGSGEKFTGKAAAMYKLNDGAYVFYYGDFVDGIRSGYGVMFMESSIKNDLLDPYPAYMAFEGEWVNDKPNGQGRLRDINKLTGSGGIDIVVEGNFKDGLQHGDMKGELLDATTGARHYATWTATDGTAPDIKDEYIAQGYDFTGREDKHIYAVYISPDGESWWNLALPDNEYLGVFGFNSK